jgi:glyceraldehyde-3-phosphate dehydrogenase/erythrose-4-phosphate dehydrogenase
MLFEFYINHLCGEMPTNLRTGVPTLTTNFVVLSVTLIETPRKASINETYQSGEDARNLEGWLEMLSLRFVMFGINPHSYNVVSRVGWRPPAA